MNSLLDKELLQQTINGRDLLYRPFKVEAPFTPNGDQPTAITKLVDGLAQNKRNQVLLGVTGSGKTFTMAHVIEAMQRPALILAHNKTLAAQLYTEMKDFFPDNAVEYFVSYYDYYQPEAYVAKTDTYIEKDSSVNERIDRMRHSATRALLERRDVIIVASVSCIYGIGEVETYSQMVLALQQGDMMPPDDIARRLIELQYKRNDIAFTRGTFRKHGDVLEIFPAHLDERAWRLSFFGDEIETIREFDPLTGELFSKIPAIKVFPNSHYVTPKPTLNQASKTIKEELLERVDFFRNNEQFLEQQRINERTLFDLEMIQATGMCAGIENYSRHLTGRPSGEAPPTLFEYLPNDALLFVDESHVTVSQIGAMYKGDYSRKSNLAHYGFRLPSCLDNRPLKFDEWDCMRPQTIFVSATPGTFELNSTNNDYVEQVVRPTGLLDPICEIRPTDTQVDNLLYECHQQVAKGHRILVTTLTKRMSEDLTEYMQDANLKVRYLHSDIDTLERTEIIHDLRAGIFDILVGINLLREGLDIPECALVAILDADKEGFLRSRTSLIQTIGRAARHVEGRVILYADTITKSIEYALNETQRRREKQHQHNIQHGITPTSIKKNINVALKNDEAYQHLSQTHIPDFARKWSLEHYLKKCEKAMMNAAKDLQFEEAASLRDELRNFEHSDISLPLTLYKPNKKILKNMEQ